MFCLVIYLACLLVLVNAGVGWFVIVGCFVVPCCLLFVFDWLRVVLVLLDCLWLFD